MFIPHKASCADLEQFLSGYCEEVCEMVLEHWVVLQVIVGEERDPHIS